MYKKFVESEMLISTEFFGSLHGVSLPAGTSVCFWGNFELARNSGADS